MSKITPKSLLLLIAVAVAVLVDALDISIVNIALPKIAVEFGVDAGSVSWAIVIYSLTVAGTLLIFGNIAARGHIKKILLLGFAVFTLASLGCGFSTSLPMLILSRFVQGIGASMILACAPLICVKFMPPEHLGFSFGVLATATSIGLAAGPALGGFITHYLSWHWIFFIDIPIGIFAILYGLKIIPKEQPEQPKPFDWMGAVLLFITMASGIYALERLPHLGITNPQIFGCIILCFTALILLCVHEYRSKNPLINIRIFKRFNVTACILSFLIVQILYCGLLYLLPFYMASALQFDSFTSGLYLLIPPVVTALISVPLSRWSDKTGRRWFMTAASFLFVVVNSILAVILPVWGVPLFICSLILMGVGVATQSGPGSSRIVESMPKGEEELGSTLTMTCGYVGGISGIGIYAAILTFATMKEGEVLSFAELPPELFLAGFHITMAVGAVLAVFAVVLSAVVKDVKSE